MPSIIINTHPNYTHLNTISHEISSILPSHLKIPSSALWQFPNYHQKLTIDLIRQLQRQFIQKTGANIYVYFFHRFDHASNIVQNSLLKILEEPPKNTIFILQVQNLSAILDTIKSRCHLITPITQPKKISYLNYFDFNSWNQFKPSHFANFLQEKINHLHQEQDPTTDLSVFVLSILNQLLLEIDQSILEKKISLSPQKIFTLKKQIHQTQTYLSTNLKTKTIITNFAYQYYDQQN